MSNGATEDVDASADSLRTLSLQEPAAQPEKKEQGRPRGQSRRNNNNNYNNREEKGRQGRSNGVNGHDYQNWNEQNNFVRIADGRGAPMGFHYSVEQQDQYAMYGNPYDYQQGYERSVRVMQAYPSQYPYEVYPEGQWAPYYNPVYYQQPPQAQDGLERRAEQIGEGEGFGDSCPCCAGNPENCQAQQCAERGFCGCLFGAMDAGEVVDDTWKDEWFAASRTCACCEGYIYRCKAQDDACSSGTCVCSHTKTVEPAGT